MSSKYSMLYEDEASAPGPSPTIAPLPLRTSKYASLYEDDESLVEASEPEPTPTPEPQQPQATPNTFGSYPSAIDYKAVGKGLSEAFGKPRIDATTGAGTTTKPYRASQGTFG